MADPTLAEIMVALADQIRGTLAGTPTPLIEGLQVEPKLTYNPSAPAIDIYPADPFQAAITFGGANNEMFFTVRARVNTPDSEGAQDTLLAMMDSRADTSVARAVLADRTLGSKVEQAMISEGPSNFGIFTEPLGQGAYLGCTWTVRVTP